MNLVNKKAADIGNRAKALGKDVSKVDSKQIRLLDIEFKAAMIQLQYDRIDERLDRVGKERSYTSSGKMRPRSTETKPEE